MPYRVAEFSKAEIAGLIWKVQLREQSNAAPARRRQKRSSELSTFTVRAGLMPVCLKIWRTHSR